MVIDIILAIVVAYGFYVGFSRGIISTIFTLLSLTLGLMAAFKFAPATTEFLRSAFDSQNPLMFIAGFLLSFVIVMVIIRFIARSLEGLLKTININFINQIAGGALMAGIFILLYSVLLWFADQGRMLDAKTKAESMTYEYLEPVPAQARLLAEDLKPIVMEFWNSSMDMMDELEQISIEQTERTSIEDRSDELPEE